MTVTSTTRDGITVVCLDRPERRNAVDGPTALALAEAFAVFDADESARVAVFHGTGGTFCAGADLKALAEGDPAGAVRAARGRPRDPTAPTARGTEGRDG